MDGIVAGEVEPFGDDVVSDRPLTLIEAAEYLQVPLPTLRQLCKRRKISHARLNYRSFRFSRSDLDAYLAQRTIRANGTY
jgi:excisionase family DNA binding protein